MRRRICVTVEYETKEEFNEIYLSIDENIVENIKTMCWCDEVKTCGLIVEEEVS